MAGEIPGIRLPDIYRDIPALAFGNHTQLEVGLGTSYFCRVGTGRYTRRKDIPFWERRICGNYYSHSGFYLFHDLLKRQQSHEGAII